MNKWLCGVALAFIAMSCATTSDSLRSNSRRLEDRAQEFYSSVRYQGDDSYRDRVSRDANDLVTAARDLNREADRGAKSERVREEYDRVAREYEQLHRDLADEGYAAQNRRVLEDFDRVTNAYRDLEATMAGRYARVDRDRD